MKWRYCKGCKFEHKKDCPNDHRNDAPKHKDGTAKIGYCAYYSRKG